MLSPTPDPATGKAQWISVPSTPDSYTINVADFLMRWTNGVYRSTIHRVVNRDPQKGRYSVPFFFSINYDEEVETLPSCMGGDKGESKYPPIKAGEYALERLRVTLKEAAEEYREG